MAKTDIDALVLLPGVLCDVEAWRPQVDYFKSKTEVIVADYGDADTLQCMAQRALEQAPEKFALAGHSMGARVALELFDMAPQRVTRIALLDTGVHPIRPTEQEKRFALRDIGREQGMQALVERWLPPMVHPLRVDDTKLMEPLYAMALKPGVIGYERHVHALLTRRDAAPILNTIHCPVLVGVGADDAWSPPEQHQQIVDILRAGKIDVDYQIFADTGHMAPVEAPELVTAALEKWLQV